MTAEPYLQFVPSRVEGVPDVGEVVVRPDQLELQSAGRWLTYPFEEMARWPWPAWLWRSLSRVGVRPGPLPVGDRDWFHAPPDRYFAFYTEPPIVVYMPPDEPAGPYSRTHFFRVQQVMRAGGFTTFDLG
jgi:hypothetical protein